MAVLVSVGISLRLQSPWPLVFCVLLSLSIHSVKSYKEWTPSGTFGPANSLTWARILATTLLVGQDASLAVPIVAVAIFALDGVDGAIARKLGSSSEYGATIDKECDAFFILALTILLWWHGVAGIWILIPGLWRYVYGAILALRPALQIAPRSQWARYTYSTCSLCLCAALVPANPIAVYFAAFATLAMSASFVRSLYYSWPRS